MLAESKTKPAKPPDRKAPAKRAAVKKAAAAKRAPKRAAKAPARQTDEDEPLAPPPPGYVMGASIIGMSELHLLVGVKDTTVNRWSTLRRQALKEGRIDAAHRKLPPYDYPSINGHPAWDRRTILKWAAENGKIEDGTGVRAPWLLEEAGQWMPAEGYKRPRRSRAQMEADRARIEASDEDPDA